MKKSVKKTVTTKRPTKAAPKAAPKKATTKKVVAKKAAPKKAIAKKAAEPNKLPPKLVQTKQGLVEAKPKTEKKDNNKYIKVFTNEPPERFKEIGEMVFRKELKWVCYGTENFMGYHYYLKLNTEKK